eukprot:11124543-Prorocentrum_lima.AAC.1
MTSSLVGSEMCIRDSKDVYHHRPSSRKMYIDIYEDMYHHGPSSHNTYIAVSYTHLTLPTICSV